MQQISVYLYPNNIDVFTNVGAWTTERYRKVYQRNIKVYGGMDNRIKVQVKNADQKSLNITGSTVVFTLVGRDTQELILERDCTVTDLVTGKINVTLTAADLLDIETGSYQYSLHRETRTTINADEYLVIEKTPLYSDSQYGTLGTIEIAHSIYGAPTISNSIKVFSLHKSFGESFIDYYVSGIIDAKPEVSAPNSLHTFQFYFSNYSGSVTIQGSLSEGGNPEVWADVTTLNFENATNDYHNLTGKYNWFRIKHTPTSGTVDKVLYR
jgi:hypothetical protein